jgi:ATP-binding cassette subfamily B protein
MGFLSGGRPWRGAWWRGLQFGVGRAQQAGEGAVRLALARARRGDAALLVLDEPSSALDARTQREIIAALDAAAAQRATLIVSHRPEMLALARRVIVLRDGIIAEEGAPDALRAAGGPFARLFG